MYMPQQTICPPKTVHLFSAVYCYKINMILTIGMIGNDHQTQYFTTIIFMIDNRDTDPPECLMMTIKLGDQSYSDDKSHSE